MRRFAVILVILTACAGTGDGAGTTDLGATTTSTADLSATTAPGPAPETTEPSESPSETTEAPNTTAATSNRPVAPDFTLELGDGGRYALSAADKPVYLVFWAEW